MLIVHPSLQVTMKLIEGRGSSGQMEGLGVQYHEHRIIVSIVRDNALTGNLGILLPFANQAGFIGGPVPPGQFTDACWTGISSFPLHLQCF